MKVLFKGGQWTNTEDEILKAGVMKYGKHAWGRIASMITRKTANQCKQRWSEYLNPMINRSEWSTAEEVKLTELVQTFPSQWRLIASQMPGRTASQCLEQYEKLLDRTRGEAAAAAGGDGEKGVPPPVQFTEQDRSWESKPARADAVDADGYEQDMLDAARGRLANNKGKKQLRKERERQLAEAKLRASLQKQRELREAGLGGGTATGAAAADDDDDADDDDHAFTPVRLTDAVDVRQQRAERNRAAISEKHVKVATEEATATDAKAPVSAGSFAFRLPGSGGAADLADAPGGGAMVLLPASKRRRPVGLPTAAAQPKRKQPPPPPLPQRAAAPPAAEQTSSSAVLGSLPSLSAAAKVSATPSTRQSLPIHSSTKGRLLAELFADVPTNAIPPSRFVQQRADTVVEAMVEEELRATAAVSPINGVADRDALVVAGVLATRPFSTLGALTDRYSIDDARREASALIDAEVRQQQHAGAEEDTSDQGDRLSSQTRIVSRMLEAVTAPLSSSSDDGGGGGGVSVADRSACLADLRRLRASLQKRLAAPPLVALGSATNALLEQRRRLAQRAQSELHALTEAGIAAAVYEGAEQREAAAATQTLQRAERWVSEAKSAAQEAQQRYAHRMERNMAASD